MPLCQWTKPRVVLAHGRLHALSGVLSRDDIVRIIRRARRRVHLACGLRIRLSNGVSGDIIPFWGDRSQFWMPCQRQPATGWLEERAVRSQPQIADRMFSWLVAHEVLGHGLGIDHHEMGSIVGYDPNGNPTSLLPREFKRSLRQRYGRPPRRR